MKKRIFERQNIVFKLFTILVAIFFATIVDANCFFAMFLVSILYFLLETKIFLHWFNLVLKLFPFFSSLIFLTIIFRIDFYQQMLLIMRIVYILLLSVYLVKSSSIEQFIAINQSFKSKYCRNFISYVVATISFIPHFLENFRVIYHDERNVVEAFVKAIAKISKLSNKIWLDTCEMMDKEIVREEFWNFPNLLLMIFFAVEIIFLSIKF